MKEQVKVFCDHIGRVVAGVLVSEDAVGFSIKSPVIVSVQLEQSQDGRQKIHVQPVPYIFGNLIKPGTKNVWYFSKSNTVVADVELEPNLEANILAVAAQQEQPTPAEGQGSGKVINLFDS